jgi:hypothetical protein
MDVADSEEDPNGVWVCERWACREGQTFELNAIAPTRAVKMP